MPFRFKKSESPGEAVRRICRECVGKARRQLRHGARSAAIHSARREIKRLRAVFRLVRASVGGSVVRKDMKRLRAAADFLAAPRDAWARLKAFEKLTGDTRRRFVSIEKALLRHCRRETRRFQKSETVAIVDRVFRKMDRRARRLKIKASGWAAIEPGLKESYSRGREAFRLVCRKPLPKNFHRWRKHVKNLWYDFQLLHPACPPERRAMANHLEQLGSQLGEDHDLFLLEQFVARHCADRPEAAALNQLVESCRKTLRAMALKLGSRLYAETPAAFCRRLQCCWHLWRGERM